MRATRIVVLTILISALSTLEIGALKLPKSASTQKSRNIRAERPTLEEYMQKREELLERERSRSLGYDLVLSESEIQANEIIMAAKWSEHDLGFTNPQEFLPSRHIFEVLEEIKESKLFQILRKMPKGAILHAHDTALISADYLVTFTYYLDLWECRNTATNKIIEFKFSTEKPTVALEPACEWRFVRDEREKVDAASYDADIRKHFTLYTETPATDYTDINEVWSDMMVIFRVAESLITYKPVWESYFLRVLIEYYEDGVQYIEFRGTLPPVYDLEKDYSQIEVVQMFKDISDTFTAQNEPNFIGVKFIYAPLRIFNDSVIQGYVELAQQLTELFPTFVAGFDLVGQEDLGRPTVDFIEPVLNLPDSINRFFHAGETNWYGSTTDENMLDAILLGSKRIGHGYALVKHPKLLELVKERDILIEVNPVSNQVLKLVDEFRNHPCAVLFADNYPVVISSDDPSFWETYPLTHDFYEAFLGMAARWQDLRLLKKLAMNSLQYSSMSVDEKRVAMTKWESWWDRFIADVIATNKLVG